MTLERDAEDFLNAKLNNCNSILSPSFIYIHSKSVREVSLKLSFFSFASKNALKVAAWLHDIGRTVNDKEHRIEGVKIAEEWFERQGIKNERLIRKVLDCIKNHGREDFPETKEGKIMRIADKIALVHPETLDYHYEKENISDIRDAIRQSKEIDGVSIKGKILRHFYIRRAKKKYDLREE